MSSGGAASEAGLTREEKEAFIRDGFVVVKNAVPQRQVTDVRALIESAIGDILSGVQPMTAADLKSARKGAFLPRVATNPAIAALFNGDRYLSSDPTTGGAAAVDLGSQNRVRSLVESLVGSINIRGVYGGQIALRFPGTLCMPGTRKATPFWQRLWHIDGFHAPEGEDEEEQSNDVSENEIHNFTLLVGVYLSDSQAEEFCGNFCAYPGSHHILGQHFRDHGFEEVLEKGLKGLPSLKLGRPRQVCARAGDVVLSHYMTAHTIAPNESADTRYAVYFRFNCRENRQLPDDGKKWYRAPMQDIWLDYQGPEMQDCIRKQLLLGKAKIPTTDAATPALPAGYVDATYRGDFLASRQGSPSSFDQVGDLGAKIQQLLEQNKISDALPFAKEAVTIIFPENSLPSSPEEDARAAAFTADVGANWMMLVHLGMVLTTGPGAVSTVGVAERERALASISQGELLLRFVTRQYPFAPSPCAMLIHNLWLQHELSGSKGQSKISEIPGLIERLIVDCLPENAKDDAVLGVLKLAAAALPILAPGSQRYDAAWLGRMSRFAVSKYPELRAEIDAIGLNDDNSLEVQTLWAEAQAQFQDLMRAHAAPGSRSAPEMQKLLVAVNSRTLRLVKLMPRDENILYWSRLLAGSTAVWLQHAGDAEIMLREAVSQRPDLPHGYEALAKCLNAQRKSAEVVSVAKSLLSVPALREMHKADHQEKVVQVLAEAKSALIKHWFDSSGKREYESLRSAFAARWPELKVGFRSV